MRSNLKVAYVVVGWNNRDLLHECFASIEKQTHSHKKVVYVDNNSTDDSVEYVRQHFPEVQVIESPTNTGFARGNNIGIAHALEDKEVEYVVLLNSDARLGEEWTSLTVQFAQKKPKGALFQGTTHDYYDHSIIDSTHIFVAQNGQGTQGNWRKVYAGDSGPKSVFGVNAAACMISRKFIDEQPLSQLFDERMFMYLEDVDLAARALVLGWGNYLVRGARAFHMGSASSGKNPGFSLYMTFRNNSAMLLKNFPLRLLFRLLPSLVRGDIDTLRTLRSQGQKRAAVKVVRGRTAGLFRCVLFVRKRYIIRSKSQISNEELWRFMRRGY